MLFLLKIAVTPLLVAGVSLAARWWGPTVGGLLMGLPWFTGPVLFVLAHDKGNEFAVAACVGIELGVVCISAFMLAYALISKRYGWPLSLTGAVAAFAAAAWATRHPGLVPALTYGSIEPLWTAAGLGLLSLVVAHLFLPVPSAPQTLRRMPWWDIPMRMVTTAALVTALFLTTDLLGPRLSGILSTYPVVLTVIGTFTHHRWGHEATWGVLRGLTRSLLAFVAFFLVVGLSISRVGLAGSYVLASAVAIVITAALVFFSRRTRMPAPSPLRATPRTLDRTGAGRDR